MSQVRCIGHVEIPPRPSLSQDTARCGFLAIQKDDI